MNHIEIKHMVGEEELRYEELCGTAFHARVEHALDREVLRENVEKANEEAKRNKTALYGNSLEKIGLFQDGKLAAGWKNHAFVVRFDGNLCEMNGIGGVLSDPDMRGQGHITRLFEDAFPRIKERKQVFSVLNPFKAAFYRQYGYEPCLCHNVWSIPIDYLPEGKVSGIKHYENDPQQQEDIKKIYSSFAGQLNMSVDRSEKGWKDFFCAHRAYESDFFSYLHYTGEEPDGFLSYTYTQQENEAAIMEVRTMYYTTPKALKALLGFMRSFRAYTKIVKFHLPESLDITYMLDEICGAYGRYCIKRELVHTDAARVVDVEEALKLAKYRGAGKVNLKVKDAYCPWNDGCFHVEFDGESTKVSKTEVYDMELDIRAFTVLILGRYDFEEHIYMDNVKVYGNEENLKKVFYKKKVWMEEGF